MKRSVITVVLTSMALAGAGVAAADSDRGNGARKAGLSAAPGLAPLVCQPGSASAGKQSAHGFAVLNAPGRPGQAHKVLGTITLKGAEPGTYDVRLVGPGAATGPCGTSVTTLEVDEQGNGSAHFQDATKTSGTYHVVLTRPLVHDDVPADLQQYASAPVTLR